MGKYTEQLRAKLKQDREILRMARKLAGNPFSLGKKLMPNVSIAEMVQGDARYKPTKAMRTASKPMSPKQKAALKKAQKAAAIANRKR